MSFEQALTALERGLWVRRPGFEADWSPFCFIARRDSLPAGWAENDRVRARLAEEVPANLVWVYLESAEDVTREVCPCNLAAARFTAADREASDWDVYVLPSTKTNG